MLSFAANGTLLFAFEDLMRAGETDESFIDLVFTMNAEIVPAPASTLGLILLETVASRRRRGACCAPPQPTKEPLIQRPCGRGLLGPIGEGSVVLSSLAKAR